MAFKINPKPEFDFTLKFDSHQGEQKIDVKAKYKTKSELVEFAKSLDKEGLTELEAIDLVSSLFVSWSGVVDENNKPLEYSKEALKAIIDNWYLSPVVIYLRYCEAVRGAKEKN